MNVLKQIKTIFIFEHPTLKDKGSVKITRERSILFGNYGIITRIPTPKTVL